MTDRRTIAVIHWITAAGLFGAFFLHLSVLWDTDSYYHLAVARLYAAHGPFARIPWARFSLLSNGADKDLLFHLLLMPFTALPDAAIGGRIALALINATLATIIGVIAARRIGNAGFLVPLWLWISAPLFFARIVRLRPELPALGIILLAILAAASRRWLALGVLAFAFTTGYTAFHVFAALCLAWFAWSWLRTRTPDFRLVAAPLVGIAAGLVLRPHPLENLRIWYVQNVLFFAHMQQLDVGNEIAPPALLHALAVSAVFILALVVLVATALRRPQAAQPDPLIAYFAITAVFFVILFFRYGRMALYAFPLVALSVIVAFGDRVAPRFAAVLLIAATIVAIPITFDREKRRFIESGTSDVSELDWSAFGRAVPAGAKVAARWGDADAYAFWAPQGRYLNVLDPIFMALPYPRQYAAQRRVFDGLDPDFPLTVARTLDSEFIALDWTAAAPDFVRRLRNDPRIAVVYGGYNGLFRIVPSSRFVTDWGTPAGPLAGFVEVKTTTCATVTHLETFAATAPRTYEFAGWGPSKLSIDGVPRASTAGRGAFLGRGIQVTIDLPPGTHRFDVRTCRARGMAGFFLLDRS